MAMQIISAAFIALKS